MSLILWFRKKIPLYSSMNSSVRSILLKSLYLYDKKQAILKNIYF